MTDEPAATQEPTELTRALMSIPPDGIVADRTVICCDPPYAMPKLSPHWDVPRHWIKDWILDTRFGCGIMQTGPRVLTIVDGGELAVGTLRLQFLHVPGHCADHLTVYEPSWRILITGDLLFHRWRVVQQGLNNSLPQTPQRRNCEAPAEPRASHTADEEAAIIGSNNWAVDGAHSASGRAMVANDMHLAIGVPNIWYRASMALPDPAEPLRIVVQGQDVDLGELQEVPGLASRGGAGVQHPLAIRDVEKPGRPLGAGILDACESLGEAGDLGDGAGVDPHRHLAQRPRLDAGRGQALQIRRKRRAAAVHPQGHGGVAVLGGDDLLPPVGALLPQLLDPPGGKAELHLRRVPGRPSEVVMAPQEVAQHRVHQAPGRGLPQPLRCADRVVHDGVGLGSGQLELGQCHEEEAPEPRMPDRGEEQPAQLGLEQAQRAQFIAFLAVINFKP